MNNKYLQIAMIVTWMMSLTGLGAIAMTSAVTVSPNPNAAFVVAALVILCVISSCYFISQTLSKSNEHNHETS